jgi:hypothetical protein
MSSSFQVTVGTWNRLRGRVSMETHETFVLTEGLNILLIVIVVAAQVFVFF